MDERVAWLYHLVGVTEEAVERAYLVGDPLLYAELFTLQERLERRAASADADCDLSRARLAGRMVDASGRFVRSGSGRTGATGQPRGRRLPVGERR